VLLEHCKVFFCCTPALSKSTTQVLKSVKYGSSTTLEIFLKKRPLELYKMVNQENPHDGDSDSPYDDENERSRRRLGPSRARNHRYAPSSRPVFREKPELDQNKGDAREDILEEITNDLKIQDKNWTMEPFKKKYGPRIDSCRPDKKYPSLGHWLVDRKVPKKDGIGRIAVRIMLHLVMLRSPDSIKEQNNLGETVIHMAVAEDEPHQERLARLICKCPDFPDGPWTNAVKEAIAVKNKANETCIHLAIAARLEIAGRLIELADERPFSIRRDGRDEGKQLLGSLNTPLHDALAYELCVFDVPDQCKSFSDGKVCSSCEDTSRMAERGKDQAFDIITRLVVKYGKALTIKNSEDESPYMHLLRNLDHMAKQQPHSVQVPAHDYARGNETPEGSRPSAARGKFDTQFPIASKATTQSGTCTTRKDGTIAKYAERLLFEHAFVVGDFDEVCKCFFGDKPGTFHETSVVVNMSWYLGEFSF
jgi:hypothetical protein